MSATLSEGALDTREEFEGVRLARGRYPRSFRRAVDHGRWERASWLEARHAERWLTWLCMQAREAGSHDEPQERAGKWP